MFLCSGKSESQGATRGSAREGNCFLLQGWGEGGPEPLALSLWPHRRCSGSAGLSASPPLPSPPRRGLRPGLAPCGIPTARDLVRVLENPPTRVVRAEARPPCSRFCTPGQRLG